MIDGPFTESKELIASYALFEVKSMDEAIMWTTRFLEVLGHGECELRPIYEASDFAAEVFSPEQAARERHACARQTRSNAAEGVACAPMPGATAGYALRAPPCGACATGQMM